MTMLLKSWCPGSGCDPCACPWKRFEDTVTFKFLTGYPAWDPTVSYAPGALVSYFEQPFMANSPVVGVDPNTGGFSQWELQDTTDMPLDQAQLCTPYWGVGAIAVGSGHAPGDIINGEIILTLLGSWENIGASTVPTAPPALPPAIHVIYQGLNVFTFDPGSGTITDFLATGDVVDHATGYVPGAFGGPAGIPQGNGNEGVAIYGGGWTAKARITVPGCIYLDGTNAHVITSPLTYNAVLPYTGPIPDPATVAQVTPSSDTSTTGPTVFTEEYLIIGGDWVDSGNAFHLAQTASFLSPYYLHAR